MNNLSSVLDEAQHWPVRVPKRRLIYDEGDAAAAIFRIERGCVRLQVNGEEGHRQIVSFLFPGELFGVCVETRTTAAEAVVDCDLTRFSLASLLQLSMTSSEIVFELIRSANNLYNDLAHHIEQITHLDAKERVLWFLTWLSHRQGGGPREPVSIPMTYRDISDFLALSPETLSRVIHDLQAQGLIEVRGRRTFVLRVARPKLHLVERNSEEQDTDQRTMKSVDRGRSETA